MTNQHNYKKITIDDLTVGEILCFLPSTICSAKLAYVKHGKNLRGAWNQLISKKDEYERLCNSLGIVDNPALDKYASDSLKFFKSGVSQKEVFDRLNNYVPKDWFKQTDPAGNDERFNRFKQKLSTYLKEVLNSDKATYKLELINPKNSVRPAKKLKSKR